MGARGSKRVCGLWVDRPIVVTMEMLYLTSCVCIFRGSAVPISLTDATVMNGLYTETCIVLAQGLLGDDGVFRVSAIGHPPVETRTKSLVAMGIVDPYQVMRTPAEMRREAELEEKTTSALQGSRLSVAVAYSSTLQGQAGSPSSVMCTWTGRASLQRYASCSPASSAPRVCHASSSCADHSSVGPLEHQATIEQDSRYGQLSLVLQSIS